jgi:pilus assembly protein CpaB
MRSILIGTFALVFGISAAVGVYLMTGTKPNAVKTETVSVVVAAADMNRGQTLATEHLTMREWPKELIPEGTITNLEEIIERTVAIPLLKGDLLLEGKLAAKGTGRGLAAIIPAGMRAVTIQTPNVATGVAGFILPGNRVDVLLTMSSQGKTDETGGGSTITLLQNLEILAVDQQTDVPEENKVDSTELRSVTLLVTPADAARLDLGQNKGTLRLTLRNPTDEMTDFVTPVTLAGLHRDPSEPDEELSAPAVAPQINVPVATPTTARPNVKSIPQIRTLRGTRAGLIQISPPETAPTETIEDPSSNTASDTKPSVSGVEKSVKLAFIPGPSE